MALTTYNFPEHLRGNTFEVKPFRITKKLEDNTIVPVDLTGAQIKMSFKLTSDSRTAFEFDTEDSTIELTNPANGEFEMKEQIIGVSEGNYQYDALFIFADNTVKTQFKGVMPVVEVITHE